MLVATAILADECMQVDEMATWLQNHLQALQQNPTPIRQPNQAVNIGRPREKEQTAKGSQTTPFPVGASAGSRSDVIFFRRYHLGQFVWINGLGP